MIFPHMMRVRQVTPAPRETDVRGAVDRELDALNLSAMITPGSTIAVTAGSRGIVNIDSIIHRVVDRLQASGAQVFLFPAMGSHGGGSAQGQVEILESLGITAEKIGAPVRPTMETVEIGRSRFGFGVFVDAFAAAADGVVVINRIKPHTDFEGPIESGLMKMMAIGMGKHKGCFEVHQQTVQYGYRQVIPAIGEVILQKLPILFGLGIVENAYDQTALIRAVPADQIAQTEPLLLQRAKQMMARLPVDRLDLLIVDEMGKNISGTGMDTNVIGRIMFIGEPEPLTPAITRIVVLNLSEASHGNAIGVGLADFTTQSLLDQVDLHALATNAVAAMTPEKGRLPIALANDREAVEAGLKTIGPIAPEQARVIHIKNTLELGIMEVSQALVPEMEQLQGFTLEGEPQRLTFNDRNRLRPVDLNV